MQGKDLEDRIAAKWALKTELHEEQEEQEETYGSFRIKISLEIIWPDSHCTNEESEWKRSEVTAQGHLPVTQIEPIDP